MDRRWKLTSSLPLMLVGVAVACAGCSEGPEMVPEVALHDRIRSGEEVGVPSIEIDGLWSSDWPDLPGVLVDTLVSPSAGDDFGLVAPLYAALLSDGGMLLADVGATRVWIGDGHGGWSQGPGPGQGPGELRSIGGIWMNDGGFVVHDPLAGDFIQYSVEGGLIERRAIGTDRALHGARGQPTFWTPPVQRVDEDSWLVAVPVVRERTDPQALVEAEIRFVWVTENPSPQEREIAVGSAQPMVVLGGGWAPALYAPSAFGAGGNGRVVVFTGTAPEVDVFDRTGAATLRVRWTDVPMVLGASHRSTLGTYMRANFPPEAPEEAVEELLGSYEAAMTYPETLPPLGGLRLGSLGDIWLGWPERSGLELPASPELIREWRIVAPAAGGTEPRVFKFALPANSTLLSLGENASGEEGFLLLIRDELERQGIGFLRYDLGQQ